MAATRSGNATPLLEWIAAGIGLLLLCFVFAVIGRAAIRGDTMQPPQVEVEVRRIAPAGAGWLVAFEAVNRTNGTAAQVEVEGNLGPEGAPVEKSSTVIDYVPGRGRARGGLYFTHDPRHQPLEVRALGYRIP